MWAIYTAGCSSSKTSRPEPSCVPERAALYIRVSSATPTPGGLQALQGRVGVIPHRVCFDKKKTHQIFISLYPVL